MQSVDATSFAAFWAPIVSVAAVTVLAPPEQRHTLRRSTTVPRGETMSDAVFLTRLQARLFGMLRVPLGDQQASRFVVEHAGGGNDHRHAERGHVLVLGGAPQNPAAEQMVSWLGLARLGLPRRLRNAPGAGLLTFAVNPLSRREDARTYIIGATGEDRAATMAAADCLLDDAKIRAVLPELRHVLEGRLSIVEIEVPAIPRLERAARASREASRPA